MMSSSYEVMYLEMTMARAAAIPTTLLMRSPPFRPNRLAIQPPMKPPTIPPMAKMETTIAYIKVDRSYVMFSPSFRRLCANLINFSITWKRNASRLKNLNFWTFVSRSSIYIYLRL